MIRRGGSPPWTLEHVKSLITQVEHEAEQELPIHRHAAFAANSLVDELTKMYFDSEAVDLRARRAAREDIGANENSPRISGKTGTKPARRPFSIRTAAAVGMLAGRSRSRGAAKGMDEPLS
jgi:hypothetical protein